MYSEERSGRFGPGMTASSAAAGLFGGSVLWGLFPSRVRGAFIGWMSPTRRCLSLGLLALMLGACGGSEGGSDAGADAFIVANDQGVVGMDAGLGSDAGDPDAAAGPDSGLLPFGAMCTANPECETSFCYNFNARGMLCTAQCVGGQCPIAGHTCNNMGVCRP